MISRYDVQYILVPSSMLNAIYSNEYNIIYI